MTRASFPSILAVALTLAAIGRVWAQPVEPADVTSTPPASSLTARISTNEGAVIGVDAAGVERWRLTFPDLTASSADGDVVHVAVAHQVITLSIDEGRVLRRVATAGPVVALESVDGELRVTNMITLPDGPARIEASWSDGALTPPARFDPQGTFYDALAREAAAVDPIARLERDTTNPFVHLRVALASADPIERAEHAAAAIAAGTTFFDLAHLARAFAAEGMWGEADAAFSAAAADFTARGYDPALLTDRSVHDRYGFPLLPLEEALTAGHVDAADLYARHLGALTGPDLPGAGAALRAYAAAQAARGERDAAALWRERAAAASNPTVSEALARNALLAGRGGTIASLAVTVALLMLHLTLFAKYRRAQAFARRQRAERGMSTSRAWALRAIRFYGTTEKLVLLTLLATAYAAVALLAWVERGDVVQGVAGVGTSETHAGAVLWDGAAGDASAVAWVNAYRANAAGDLALALSILTAAPASDANERAASALSRGESIPTPPPSVWRAAIAGTYVQAIIEAFTEPWTLFGDRLAMLGLPTWSWPIQLTLFWLVVAWHVLWLPFPRPAFARVAPRPIWYELLALSIPGTGQADELYGVLLLIPWSIVTIDTVTQALGAPSALNIPQGAGTSVLVVLYVFNTIGWGIEWSSTRRRLTPSRHSLVARSG